MAPACAEDIRAGLDVDNVMNEDAVGSLDMSECFGGATADALLRILRDGPLGREAAKRELGIRTAADLQDAIDLLRHIGAVETVRVARAGGGRPAEVLRLAGVTAITTQTTPVPAQERGPEGA